MFNKDLQFLEKTYDLAQQAYHTDNVPVGAVLVYNNEIIATGINNSLCQLDHAEIVCIKNAEKKNFNNFHNSVLYVSLEPCLMCLGAIMHVNISQVIYGLESPLWGYSLLLNDNTNKKKSSYYTSNFPLVKKINYNNKQYEDLIKNYFKEKRK
jgi:tRNA(adenine34) deaminase